MPTKATVGFCSCMHRSLTVFFLFTRLFSYESMVTVFCSCMQRSLTVFFLFTRLFSYESLLMFLFLPKFLFLYAKDRYVVFLIVHTPLFLRVYGYGKPLVVVAVR
ncbi:hypothetical protein F5H01DRAFT_327439 [Linnemannia elongata]|nr:hypothetical protein F5H01DRAFT_327439 [Linnemannia elongata]